MREIPGEQTGLAIELHQPLVVFRLAVLRVGVREVHYGIGGISCGLRISIQFPQGSGIIVQSVDVIYIALQSQLEAGFQHVVDRDFENAELLGILMCFLDDRSTQLDDLVVAIFAELAVFVAIARGRHRLESQLSHLTQGEFRRPWLRLVDDFGVFFFGHPGVFFELHPVQLLERLLDWLGTDRSDRNDLIFAARGGSFSLFVISGRGRCGGLLATRQRPGDEGQTAPLMNRSHGLSFP